MPRTAYKHLDRTDPDAWVVWDEKQECWLRANLVRNPLRADPLLVDENGRRHKVGDNTRCQSLESFFREGDLTQIPHKWHVDEASWAPTLAEGEYLGSGFQRRDWSKVR